MITVTETILGIKQTISRLIGSLNNVQSDTGRKMTNVTANKN